MLLNWLTIILHGPAASFGLLRGSEKWDSVLANSVHIHSSSFGMHDSS